MATCDDCLKLGLSGTEKCLACPRFHNLFINAEYSRHDNHESAAAGYRLMQVIGASVVGAGMIAAIADMAIVGGSMIFFGIGLLLADFLSRR